MKPTHAVDMDTLPAHQRPQIGHAGSGVQNFMESQIRFVEAFEIAVFGAAALTSKPFSRITRRTRRGLARTPAKRNRAHNLR